MKDKTPLDITAPSQNIDIKPGFCGLNSNKDGTSKPLTSEPGIPELEMLYYDVYDYNTCKFTSMSEDMVTQYNKDVQTFYTLFTGETQLPKEITKFGQIPLRNYQKLGQCKTNGAFTKSYTGTLKENLFKNYVDNVKTMMKNTEDNQTALLAIIDQLFVFIKDPQDPTKKLIVINPTLNNKLLSKLVTDSRVGILKLYTTCEQDFFKGLQIFEALVEKQVIDTSTAQIKRLQQNVEETISLEATGEIAPIVAQAPVPVPAPEAVPAAVPAAVPEAVPAAVPVPAANPNPTGPILDEPITQDSKEI